MSDVNIDISQLEALQKNLQAAINGSSAFEEYCVKQLAAIMLRKLISKTPVGDYSKTVTKHVYSYVRDAGTDDHEGKRYRIDTGQTKEVKVSTGKTGGTLRRGWTAGTVQHSGTTCSIEITNPTEYAYYVNYGHRQTPGRYVPAIGKRLVCSWVPGQHMIAKSEAEMNMQASQILNVYVNRFLKGIFK